MPNPQSSIPNRQSSIERGARHERQTAPTRLVYNCFDDNGLRAGVPAHTNPRPAGAGTARRTSGQAQA